MNNKNDNMVGGLPKNINKEVPTYELSNSERVTKEQGVQMAKEGNITGVAVGVSKKGEEYLRSLPDQDENNNLSSLPTVE